MQNIKDNKKAIYISFILFSILLIYQAFLGQYYTIPGTDSVHYKYGGSDISSSSMYLAGIIVAFVGIFRTKHFKRLKLFDINIFILLFVMLIWSIITVAENGLMKVLAQSTSPFVYFLYLGAYIGANGDNWKSVVKLAKYTGSLCIIASFCVALLFLHYYGGYIGNSSHILLLGTGFWPFCIYVLCSKRKFTRIEHIFHYLVMVCGIGTAVIFGARSWLLQLVFLVFLYSYNSIDDSKRNRRLVSVLVGCVAVTIAAIYILTTYYQDQLTYFIGRGLSDSRTWQFKDLFYQYSFLDMFFGKGTFATYYTNHYGDYRYFDNNTIYMLFHYGFIPMITFFIMLFQPAIRTFFSRSLTTKEKMPGAILFLWILSINGLSVYNVVTLDLRNFFIVMLIGRCLWSMEYAKRKQKTVYSSKGYNK